MHAYMTRTLVVMKTYFKVQCAGEAQYSEDQAKIQNEVFAAFVLTTVPQGKIDNIDASSALVRHI